MRKIFILSVMLIAGFGACQTKLDDEPPAGDISGESEVELSILTNSATRSTEFSTSDENIIDNLDVLLFDAEKKFVCWRTTMLIFWQIVVRLSKRCCRTKQQYPNIKEKPIGKYLRMH